MPKHWTIRPYDPDRIAHLARSANVPAVLAQLLICRGIADPPRVAEFLQPKLTALHDPLELPGCAEAADVLLEAVRDKKRIFVYGDYDVDGVTGAAILHKCLTLLSANASYYVPHRIDEGYGLNPQALQTLQQRGAECVVTVDCGATSVEEAAAARDLGLDLIITDHHQFGDVLPEARAIVHPRLPDGDYPFAHLAGAGVAWKLAWALCQKASGSKKVQPRMRNFLLHATGLAALGTVADVVPLVGENRVLVRHGLRSLQDQPGLGLATLMRITGVDQNPQLDSEHIAFVLGPRLNAAGRLGQAQLAVELLVTDKPARAEELARYIDQLNSSRQSLERSIQLAAGKQAREHFDPAADPALVLADHEWHPGVIGIVAGRLAEKFHRPVVMIAWDQMGVKPGVGSARSVPGFNLVAALESCADHLISFGGHEAAAGLKIAEDQLDAFRTAFCEHAADQISEEQRIAELTIDAEAPLSAFTLKTVQQLEVLGPFGQSNPRPLLCATGVELAGPPKTMGSSGRHLSMMLRQHDVRLRAVAFGAGDWADELASLDGPVDVAFRPVINNYRGRRNVELHLVDWRSTA